MPGSPSLPYVPALTFARPLCFSLWLVSLQVWLFSSSPLYYCYLTWFLQHVVSHHQDTNVPGADVDIHHHPIARWSPNMPYSKGAGYRNLAWHSNSFLASTLIIAFHQPLQLFKAGLKTIRAGGKLPEEYAEALRRPVNPYLGDPQEATMKRLWGKALAAGYMGTGRIAIQGALWMTGLFVFAFPAVKFGLLQGQLFKALAFSFVPFMISSLLFMIVTQVSHIQKETQLPEVLADPDFFRRQARTSLDYSYNSQLWRFLTGGLNVQSIHHVMPGVHTSHYTDLYGKFYAICEKHGCAPAQRRNVIGALHSHLSWIFELGAQGAPMRAAVPEM